MEHHLQASSEVRKALKQTVSLDNGKYGFVFTEKGYVGSDPQWTCHVCCRSIVSERAMHMHLSHPLHNSKLLIPNHPHTQFIKFSDIKEDKSNVEIVTDVVPGEPVPPGMEDVVEVVCQIQAAFDAYTAGPLVGLEYIVELISSEEESEPRYICLLCEKKGDPRSVMVHVTSQNHYLKYISCFFRTAGNALNMIPRTLETRKGIGIAVTKVAAEIEKHYGRLKPTSAEMETFMAKKYEILRQIDEKQHFRETPSTTFAHLVTLAKIKEYTNMSDDDLRPNNYMFTKKEVSKDEKYGTKDIPFPWEEKFSKNESIQEDKRMREKVSFHHEEKQDDALQKQGMQAQSFDDGKNSLHKEDRKDQPLVIDDDSDVIVVPDHDEKPSSAKSLSSISSLTNSDSRSRSRSNSKIRSRGRGRARSSSRSRSSRSISRRRRRSRSNSRSRYFRRSRRSRSKDRYRRRSPLPYRRSSPQLPYSRPRRSPSRSRSRERRPKDPRDFNSQRGYRSYNRYRSDPKIYEERMYHNEEMLREQERWRHSPRNDVYSSRSRENSIPRGDRGIRIDVNLRREDINFSKSSRKHEDFLKKLEEEKEKKIKWEQFQEELQKLEEEMEEKLKYYQTRPEKHPMYPEVWKGFWNCRYKELQQSGKDPTKHDFKPEWIIFWEKRMKELHEQDVADRKEELRCRLNIQDINRNKSLGDDLQDISPPTPEGARDVTVDDIKNTWKALTGSEIKAPSKRSLSPWEECGSPPRKSISPVSHSAVSSGRQIRESGRKFYEIVPPIVHCLRMLSVLENQLGSLGPKVLDLLSKALILEKSKPSQSMTLLQNRDIHILFETIKEKIRGQLLAGIVMRNLVPATRAVIKSIDNMLASNPLSREVFEPVKVPGVGMVDKVAVAQQIAAALVAQGKTDVSQQELEELINAVVGMAQASNTNPTQDMSSATFFSQLDIQKSTGSYHINQIISNMIITAQKSLGYAGESKRVSAPQQQNVNTLPLVSQTQAFPGTLSVNILQNQLTQNTLPQMTTPINIPNVSTEQQFRLLVENMSNPKTVESVSPVSDTELKERLMKFKELPREEQHSLIALLKELESTQPERVEKLREFVAVSLAQVPPKQSPKPQVQQKSDRLSPFSMRTGGANPSPERNLDTSAVDKNKKFGDSDDDDDYSFEDVYNAASEKLRINQLEEEKRRKEEEEQDQRNSDIVNSQKDTVKPHILSVYPTSYLSTETPPTDQLYKTDVEQVSTQGTISIQGTTNNFPEVYDKYQETYPNYSNSQYQGMPYRVEPSLQQQPLVVSQHQQQPLVMPQHQQQPLVVPQHQQQQQQYDIPSYSTQLQNFPNSSSNYPPQSYTSEPNINKKQYRMPGYNMYQNNYTRY